MCPIDLVCRSAQASNACPTPVPREDSAVAAAPAPLGTGSEDRIAYGVGHSPDLARVAAPIRADQERVALNEDVGDMGGFDSAKRPRLRAGSNPELGSAMSGG